MNWDEADCENPELILITERLHKCNTSKNLLELELDSEEFKYKYIDKRKKLTSEKVSFRMGFILPVTFIVVICLAVLISCYVYIKSNGYDKVMAVIMLVSVFVIIFMGYICIKLWLPEIRMMRKLSKSGKSVDKESNIITFGEEEEQSRHKIEILKAQIKDLEKEISILTLQQKEQESLLRGNMMKSENENSASSNGKFKIKKESVSQIQYAELLEYYDKEIQGYRENISRLELEDKSLNKKILHIDEEYKLVKKRIITFLVVVIMLTLGQNIFSGITYHVLSVVLCIVILGYFIYLINTCTKPVILYLVEHNSKIIQDYAFVNSLEPVSKRRKEIIEEIVDCKKWIQEIENKKQILRKEVGIDDTASD